LQGHDRGNGTVRLSKISTADAVVNHLKKQIEDGLLKPGGKLPSERLLQQELSVSRFTLREALARLSALGIIKTIQKRLNLFLRWDKQEQTRTAVEVDDAQKSKQISKFETVVSDTDRNKAGVIVEETTQTAGKIKQTRNTVNDFGLNDHETQERTAAEVDDAQKTKQITAFETVASDVDRNKAAAVVEETTQTPGQIKQTRNTVNDFASLRSTKPQR
jgi:DNA-binding transcriptional MocR family regulator